MFFSFPQDFKERGLAPGVRTRLAWGEKLMMSVVDLNPYSTVARHRHPHEQMGLVLQGEVEIAIGGKTHIVKKGDGYLIPSDVEHAARTYDSPARVIDIFSPPREDYI